MRHGSVSELTQTLRKKGVIERLYTEPPENSVVMCLDEMGPVAAKTFAGQAVVRLPDSRQPTPMPRAIQEIDYGRRGKGYVFGAFRPATGALVKHSPIRMRVAVRVARP